MAFGESLKPSSAQTVVDARPNRSRYALRVTCFCGSVRSMRVTGIGTEGEETDLEAVEDELHKHIGYAPELPSWVTYLWG